MADSAGLRQRNKPTSESTSSTTVKATNNPSPPSQPITLIDIIRIVAGLALAGALGSYLVTSQTSFTWGFRQPWWTRPDRIALWWKGPLLLSNEELAAYDGTDPTKPILVALNRTIYDVSTSPHVYGPSGPYRALAAKDASRSYITTCFDPVDDLVPYFGGVEEVYVPLWLSKNPSQAELDNVAPGEVVNGLGVEGLMTMIKNRIGRKKVNQLQKEAYEQAKERVRAQVRTWEGMFSKKDYPVVGRVVGVDETDARKYANLKFCEAALKQRPPLSESLGKALEALGHKDGKLDISKMKAGAANVANQLKKQYGVADKARDKRDGQDMDGKQAKDEAKVDQKVEDAAAEAVAGGEDGTFDDKAKASIEDMMAGGKHNKAD